MQGWVLLFWIVSSQETITEEMKRECVDCEIIFNDETQATRHYQTKKHINWSKYNDYFGKCAEHRQDYTAQLTCDNCKKIKKYRMTEKVWEHFIKTKEDDILDNLYWNFVREIALSESEQEFKYLEQKSIENLEEI